MPELTSSTAVLPDTSDPTQTPGPTLRDLYEMSDEQAWLYAPELLIAAIRLYWRSPVYDHFVIGLEKIPRINSTTGANLPGTMVFTFTCRHDPTRCKTLRRKRRETSSGTHNLNLAMERCNKRRGVVLSSSAAPVPYSQSRFRAHLAIWCAVNHRPFSAISDPLFVDFVQLLRPGTNVPDPKRVSLDLTYIYNRLSINVRETFLEIDTAMHLAIDGWSSPLTASFLGIIVFWRENGRMWSSILDFIHLTESHTGAYMAQKTLECVEQLGVKNQAGIMSICLDNALNNDTFIRHIAPELPRLLGEDARGRCMAHIGNLMAQAFIDLYRRTSSRKRRRAAVDSTENTQPSTSSTLPSDPSVANLLGSSSDDPDEPEVVLDDLDGILELPSDVDEGRELFDKGEVKKALVAAFAYMKAEYRVTVTSEEIREAQELFPKINGFASAILHSNTLLPTFVNIRNICKAQGEITTEKELPSSFVSTRWNSQLKTGITHLALQPAVEVMTANSNYKMEKYHLSKSQWNLLKEVCECLEIFEEITLMFSQKDTPTIHEVLPMLYLTRHRLTRMRDNDDEGLRPITRVAAHSAIVVTEKYAKLLEKTCLYPLATVLCPWYKLVWLRDNEFTNRRVQSIVRSLRNYHQTYYTEAQPSSAAVSVSTPPIATPVSRNRWLVGPAVQSTPPQPRASNSASSAIDLYLASELISKQEIEKTGGLLAHWMREQARGSPIAAMALDILTAPASSVDAERAFSGGRMAVNYRQHRMSLSTFRAKMAVGSWYGTPLLANIDEVVDIMNDGSQDSPEPLDI
ncbi:hypothetical protein FRC12_005039 [Ceratobasidium sp. 428]|nr:hypothetical protein FRC12_005039 [Ceratobasidium sp. 428]